MKILHTAIKALPRVYASLVLLLPGMALMAQNTTSKDTSRTTSPANSEQWYNQGWIWFVIIIIAIVLILALTRRSGSNIMGRDQNKFKDRR